MTIAATRVKVVLDSTQAAGLEVNLVSRQSASYPTCDLLINQAAVASHYFPWGPLLPSLCTISSLFGKAKANYLSS